MHASTLRKKVFSRVSVKFISLHGSNNSDSVPFESGAFGEIKDYSLKKTPFQKQNYFEVLGMYAAYIKTYFQEYQPSAFVFMAQITQILLFSRMPLLERSKIMVWEQDLFQKKFPMEVLGICLS